MNKYSLTYLILILSGMLLQSSCGGQPPKPLPEPLQSAAKFETQGLTAYRGGDYLTAIKYFQSALTRYRSVDKHNEQARVHINLAQSAMSINELGLAKQQLEQLDTLIRYNRLSDYEPRWLLLKSDYLMTNKEYEEAVSTVDILISKHSLGQKRLRRAALINRAIIALKTNAPDLEYHFKKARKGLAKQNSSNARLLRLEGQLMQLKQNYELAEKHYNQALDAYRKDLFQPGIAATLADLGSLMLETGQPAKAQILLKRALDIRLSMGDRYTGKHLLNQLLKLSLAANNESAARIYEKQLKMLRNQSTRW